MPLEPGGHGGGTGALVRGWGCCALGTGWQCHELQRANCGVQSQTQGAWGCLYLTALCLPDRKRP